MSTVEEFLSEPTEAIHPRLRHWRKRAAEPGIEVTVEIYKPQMDFGQSQAEINLQFSKDGHPLPLETVSWDDDLNSGLVDLHVRAVNRENEAIRFALALRGAFRKAEKEFGDGYFNSVLLELLDKNEFSKQKEIAVIRPNINPLPPLQEGATYRNCDELIAAAIKGRHGELKEKLGYSENEAKDILISALACYLDDRFSISERRRLGLL